MSCKITFIIGFHVDHPETGITPMQITFTMKQKPDNHLTNKFIIDQPIKGLPIPSKPLLDGWQILYCSGGFENGYLHTCSDIEFIQEHDKECIDTLPDTFRGVNGDIFVPIYLSETYAPIFNASQGILDYKFVHVLLHQSLGWTGTNSDHIRNQLSDDLKTLLES